MIELVNVSKYYPTDFGRHYVFQDVSLVLPLDKSVGVLGPNGAGKSTFLRLIGGADMPSDGKILKSGRISPPMGLTPGLQSSLTAAENARFAGRIYGMSRDEISDLIEYVRELANIGKFFDMPVGTYSAGMKQRVGFAINMSMSFDYYLFDEIGAGGDKEFRKTAKSLVQQRLATSKFIIASHRSDELLDICDSGIVIRDGTLTFYDDIEDALAAYGEDDEKADRESRRAKRRGRKGGQAEGDGEGAEAASESRASEDDPERQAKREQRRQRRESRDKGGTQTEPATAMPAIAAGSTADAAIEPAANDAPPAAPSSSETDDREARRAKRREKREAGKSKGETSVTTASPVTSGDGPVVSTSGQQQDSTSVTPVVQPPETPAVTAISREDMKREKRALVEARRQARLEARQTPDADSSDDRPDTTPAGDAAAEDEPVLSREELRARRSLAREERQKARATPEVPSTADGNGAPGSDSGLDDTVLEAGPAVDGKTRAAKTPAEREALRLERAAAKTARATRRDDRNASNSDS